jgi:hypothetical protein
LVGGDFILGQTGLIFASHDGKVSDFVALFLFVGARGYVQYMATRERVNFRKLVCPECKETGAIMRILWGMPGDDFDYRRFASGGCIVSGEDPDVTCRKCMWEGFRNQLDSLFEETLMPMKQNVLLSEEGIELYYWDVSERGIHFEFESSGVPGTAFSMDMEVQFVVPESEFLNLKQLFGIAADVDIEDAINEISGTERAEELCDAFNSTIKVVDRSVWMN